MMKKKTIDTVLFFMLAFCVLLLWNFPIKEAGSFPGFNSEHPVLHEQSEYVMTADPDNIITERPIKAERK